MKPFEPSCGTESLRIYELCDDCERDRPARPIEEGGQDRMELGCPILAVFGMNGRHPMVMIDEEGEIRCKRYVPEGHEIPEEDTATLPLFGEGM